MMKNYTLFLQKNFIGQDDELGRKLFVNFFKTLVETVERPKSILFVHNAVFCLLENSPIFDSLSLLAQDGVKFYACKTCCETYQIADAIQIGQIVGMSDIQKELFTHSVITV